MDLLKLANRLESAGNTGLAGGFTMLTGFLGYLVVTGAANEATGIALLLTAGFAISLVLAVSFGAKVFQATE